MSIKKKFYGMSTFLLKLQNDFYSRVSALSKAAKPRSKRNLFLNEQNKWMGSEPEQAVATY